LHFKILFSTLPFLCFAFLAIRERGRGRKAWQTAWAWD
jgi:hypothetical protein